MWGPHLRLVLCQRPFLRAQNFPPVFPPARGTKFSSALLWIQNESSSMVNGVLNLRDDSTRIVGEHPPGLHINSWCTMPSVRMREREGNRDNDIIKCSPLSVSQTSALITPPSVSIQRHADRRNCSTTTQTLAGGGFSPTRRPIVLGP